VTVKAWCVAKRSRKRGVGQDGLGERPGGAGPAVGGISGSPLRFFSSAIPSVVQLRVQGGGDCRLRVADRMQWKTTAVVSWRWRRVFRDVVWQPVLLASEKSCDAKTGVTHSPPAAKE
jgi:hypothetical protein